MNNKKPSGAKSAYIIYTQAVREEYKKKNPDGKVNFTEISKIASEKWKNISDKEKEKYNVLAQADKKRYTKEMEGYEPETDNRKPSKKAKREAKDPNKPKAPLTAFFFFSNEHRQTVKEKNPEFKVGDIAKVLGKMWSECKDKSKYEEMNKEAKEKYNLAMLEYKNGAPSAKKSKAHVSDEGDEEEYESEEEE
uniref:High mobility group-2 n=1 Tax=Schmidtea mediterranea TaxID=79327 RepID=I1ZIA1_SCHMD|nr:high mobility group-2 [Schmidtea mediterranea]